MIYFDHNASTPMLDAVKEEISRSWELFGNPSGENPASLRAANEVESARERISHLLGTNHQDLIFTSGSTEAIAIAIYGIVLAAPIQRNEILVSKIEHKAVLATCYAVAEVSGKKVIEIPVSTSGEIDVNFISENVSEKTAIVCCMSANNETGVIQSTNEILSITKTFDVPLFCDTTQSIGKDPDFGLEKLGLMISAVSGHKIYGPKGSGLAVIPRSLQGKMFKVLSGGGQERGFRGGTLNISAILGLSKALEVSLSASKDFDLEMKRMKIDFLDALENAVQVPLHLNSKSAKTLNNTLSLRFEGIPAEELLVNFREVVASRASACTAGREEPSHVLLAMGLSTREAEQSLRFSFGRGCSLDDIPAAVRDVSEAVDRVLLLGR
jgi:cysteine desulfurase